MPAAAGRPDETLVVVLGTVHQIAVGRDRVDRHDRQAGGAESTRVPPVAAAEQEPGQADVGTMTDREEQPVADQGLMHLAADHAGLDGHRPGDRVHGDLAQPGQVEQQAAVVQVPAAPAVPAGAQRDLEALGAGVPDRGRCVILGDRDHDEIGIPGRLARVPHRVLASLLVARFAAPEHRACNPLQPAKTHVGPHLVLETPLARCVHDGRGALFADVRKAGWRSANSNSACQPWPGDGSGTRLSPGGRRAGARLSPGGGRAGRPLSPARRAGPSSMGRGRLGSARR